MGMDSLLNEIIRMSKGGMMMSFLIYRIFLFCNNKPLFEKTSLQAYPKKSSNKSRISIYLYSKRMSSFLLSDREGSMTVEASIAIPVFLFAMINLLSIILLFGEYSSNLADMHRKGKELAVHAHILGGEAEEGSDLVILTKVQVLEPMIPIMGFDTARTLVNCRIRKWTGYEVMNSSVTNENQEWVYITPTGSAYHTNPNCSYLNPKIYSAVSSRIGEYRNASREIYRQCESCKDITLTGICFYTEYGNHYHSTLKCSGLKRTIYSVQLSEVDGRHSCNKCNSEGE